MSGGVDSSVAALLLKKAGYEVIGISLKLWDDQKNQDKRGRTCCSLDDITDARHVCHALDIPFYAFNHKETFKEKVVDRFVDEYYQGQTPNPCILCNDHLKFDQLLIETQKLGADYLASGHHAKILKDEENIYHLLCGDDPHKDQSYVLYRLRQDQLKKLLFPVGGYTKAQIRKIAQDHQLPTATKVESQDICFIPNRNYAEFITQYRQPQKNLGGHFVDQKGNILGPHKGIHHYTVGQRRGLEIAFGKRFYVLEIRPQTGEVVLGEASDLKRDFLYAQKVNWVLPKLANQEVIDDCAVKVRYQKNTFPAKVYNLGQKVKVEFLEDQPTVSPGQAVVFYRNQEVLGGGWITADRFVI